MESTIIEKGCIVVADTTPIQSCRPQQFLIPIDLFKTEAEAGIGEIFMGKDKDGEPCPMMKIDKQWLEDALKFWYE